MSTFNLAITRALARDLIEYMELKGLDSQSEALGMAVRESLEKARAATTRPLRWDGIFGPLPQGRQKKKRTA